MWSTRVPCSLNTSEIRPRWHRHHTASEHITGLMQAVKAYERLAARAAFSGRYQDALAAALSHPLAGDFRRTKTVLDALLEAHRTHLKSSFFEGRE